MAPGCYVAQDNCGSVSHIDFEQNKQIDLDSIPLPSTPAPVYATLSPVRSSPPSPPLRRSITSARMLVDTVDSFEVLDLTMAKQKRLARAKRPMDMRMKVLLKRTFDLVWTIMEHENGFHEEIVAAPVVAVESTVDSCDNGDALELTPDRQHDSELCARLDLETYLAENELHMQINNLIKEECSVNDDQMDSFQITVRVDDSFFDRPLLQEESLCFTSSKRSTSRSKRRRSHDDDSSEEEDDDEESYQLQITRMSDKRPLRRHISSSTKKQRRNV